MRRRKGRQCGNQGVGHLAVPYLPVLRCPLGAAYFLNCEDVLMQASWQSIAYSPVFPLEICGCAVPRTKHAYTHVHTPVCSQTTRNRTRHSLSTACVRNLRYFRRASSSSADSPADGHHLCHTRSGVTHSILTCKCAHRRPHVETCKSCRRAFAPLP